MLASIHTWIFATFSLYKDYLDFINPLIALRPRYGDNPFIIFCNCVGAAKLSYALVTCSPLSLLEAQVEFDPALRASLEKIVTALGLGFGDWQWRFATLLIKLGGLGILLAGDIISYAFLASRLQTSTLQAKILSKTGIASHGSSF
ncbi:hypothetical protein Tco_0650341 [Tanacetum coccineum]